MTHQEIKVLDCCTSEKPFFSTEFIVAYLHGQTLFILFTCFVKVLGLFCLYFCLMVWTDTSQWFILDLGRPETVILLFFAVLGKPSSH